MDIAQPWLLTLKAVAGPWHCDAMGHMNTRFIEGLFDDATFSLLDALGGGPRALAGRAIGWADRKHSFDFLAEILDGDVLEIRSRIDRVGATSLTTRHEMSSARTNSVVAEATIVTVCFDLQARCSTPLPGDVSEAARRRMQAGTADN
jgi:acyl-CoA thioester hydrolase